MPRMLPWRRMSCASADVAFAMRRMPAAPATVYAMPIAASRGTRLRGDSKARKSTPQSVRASAASVGWRPMPSAHAAPDRKRASATPAEDSCASAAPTKTIRRRTTYTPRIEQVIAMTSEPMRASRKSIRRSSNARRAPAAAWIDVIEYGPAGMRKHDVPPADVLDIDLDAVHPAQRFRREDLPRRAKAELAADDERDPLDRVRDLVQRVAHEDHREPLLHAQLADEREVLGRRAGVHSVRWLVVYENVLLGVGSTV